MAVHRNPLDPVRSILGGFSVVVGFCLGLMLGVLHPARDASSVSLFAMEHASLLINPEIQVKHTKNSDPLGEIFNRRPNWRTDFELSKWLPRWLPQETLEMWTSMRHNETHMNLFYNSTLPSTDNEAKQRDAYFWTQMARLAATWTSHDDQKQKSPFALSLANNGFGHRLAHLSYNYMCNTFPHKRQLLINWFDPAFAGTNRVWHALFEDSPLLAGLPMHWSQDPVKTFQKVNKYRQSTHTQGELNKEPGLNFLADQVAGDYNMYYRMKGPSSVCKNWGSLRDLWLLRTAKEPSIQEFYQLLRAQLRQSIKDKIANFMETSFPKDKIVVGVHIRAGNGKDDGNAHFDSTKRGDWLKDLPAAVRVVRKHLRMVAYSIMDRYNTGSSGGLDFDKDEFDEAMDGAFRIFLATDSPVVLDEFRRQHPNVLALQQDRLPDGEGVAILQGMKCSDNKSNFECQVQAQEAMLMDAYILSSCDAVVAESYSNFLYTIPASIMMAEGRAFCESGRAALGGKYVLGDDPGYVFGNPWWWKHPPSDIMPVRCHQGGWAARDRSDFSKIIDVIG